MSSWHSYPKIYALGHRAVKELTCEAVTVEEKIDGSQFSFFLFNGELRARSKGKEIILDEPEKMFLKAVDTIREIINLLHDGWTYRAEYLSKPKHNVLCYGRVPEKHLIIFDINTEEEVYLDHEAKAKEAKRIGLEVVPLLFNGKLQNASDVAELLETDSVLGGTKIEGVVVKNYERFGLDKKALMGKYVSEKFKEKHDKDWKKNNPSKADVIMFLMEKYRTEARWEKAVQHLRERGELEGSPKDIGNLIKEVQTDLHNECEDEIKGALYRFAIPKIRRKSTAGLPEWYKERLLQEQFKKEETKDDTG